MVKDLASRETIENTKTLDEFQSITKKIARTKVPKAHLNYTNQPVELAEIRRLKEHTSFDHLKEMCNSGLLVDVSTSPKEPQKEFVLANIENSIVKTLRTNIPCCFLCGIWRIA